MDWRVNSRLPFLGPGGVNFGHVESVNAVCEGHVRCHNQTRPPALTFRIANCGWEGCGLETTSFVMEPQPSLNMATVPLL